MPKAGEVEKLSADWASSIPEISELWLFGSRAKGINTATSDWDLAVILEIPEEELTRFWIEHHTPWEQELIMITGSKIDLWLAEPNSGQERVWPSVQDHGIRLYPIA